MRTVLGSALALMAFVSFGASFAEAQTPVLQREVTVNGSCLRLSQPDRASIIVTAEAQNPELQQAAKKATESYERLKKAVQKLNLKDLELTTSEYNLQEVREWQKDKSVFKGFRARMGLSVSTSETSRIGEVIAVAAKEGIRDVGSLQTFLSPEKMKVEREACLDEAVKNARSKAETLAKASSSRLGRVLTVHEGASSGPIHPPVPMAYMAKSMAADAEMAAPSVDAGPQRLTVEVTVSFALE